MKTIERWAGRASIALSMMVLACMTVAWATTAGWNPSSGGWNIWNGSAYVEAKPMALIGEDGNQAGTATNPLRTELPNETTPSAELLSAERTPLFQIGTIWGIPSGAYMSTTTGSTGGITPANGELTLYTGTGAGGYITAQSKRVARPRDGQSAEVAMLLSFDDCVANNYLLAGPQTAKDGLAVGCYGADFGVFHKVGGVKEIQQLEVTTGSGGAETVTVTLNGVGEDVSISGALSVEALAQAIADHDFSAVSVGFRAQAIDEFVTFVGFPAGDLTGSFTLSSTGTAAGTFTELRAGVTGTDNFYALDGGSSVILDPLDGTGRSGLTVDPNETHAWTIDYNTHQAIWYVDNSTTGTRVKFAQVIETSGPLLKNPIAPFLATAYNAGNTTNQTMRLSSVGAYLYGPLRRITARRGISTATASVGTTETPIVTIKPRLTFGSPLQEFNAPVYIPAVGGGSTAGKTAQFSIVLNGTLTGALFSEINAQGAVLVDTSATAITGGITLDSWNGGVDSPQRIPLEVLDLELQKGDQLTITAKSVSATADVAVKYTAMEDR